MTSSALEHVNFTVSDGARTAQMLCDVFGWKIRWQGDSIHKGQTWHVGSDRDYLAVYQPPARAEEDTNNYERRGGLNHIGITVPDLESTEDRVRAAGYEPFNHQDYEPGRRFYFLDENGIEFEVVSYS